MDIYGYMYTKHAILHISCGNFIIEIACRQAHEIECLAI